MRAVLVSLAAILAAAGAAEAATAEQGAKVYQRCAACHLPNGQGVPGAFPPLAGRIGVAASSEAGRDYLVMTIVAGLMGEIEVDGRKMRGVMPAQAGLSDADIAAVLNYAASLKPAAAAGASDVPAFTGDEVAAIRARFANANPNAVHAIRGDVFSAAASSEAGK